MKIKSLSILLFLTFCVSFFVWDYAAEADFTKWSLPEGAFARLGKGTIDDIAYSPDGSLLAVGGRYRYLAV